ncbi:MAG: formate dehydrogenase [Gemmatimonadetes bacterium]|nr:formate dehydrogenase [Gemmatimonadota bacterium]
MGDKRPKSERRPGRDGCRHPEETNVAGTGAPSYGRSEVTPERLTGHRHPDGRLSQFPPPERWNDWTEWDGRAWPKRVARRYSLVPTICFNCEAGCGLLAYVDKTTFEIRKFEGNPLHPGSRGRNCAKGPATLNQVYDSERILHPLKRAGARGDGRWQRISWDQAIDEIAGKMRESRLRRRDGIVYHVGRPGEDHYANRVVQAWGVDGHNSHTNVCSAAARTGYSLWSGADRPSPDFANARCILLLSSHLEAGHYFNPHAQRIIEAMARGARLVTIDPRLSNTAAKSHVWLPAWPGSEATLLLAIANHLLESGAYDRSFLRDWVNWREFLEHADAICDAEIVRSAREATNDPFDLFERLLRATYEEFTFERAAREARVPEERIREAARCVAEAGDRLAAHVWRGASIGNRGGWQVARCLFFLNVLTGSVGTRGGTSLNSWDKFVPRPFRSPPPLEAWNELNLPPEWPLSHYEMSFLLPHLLEEGRGEIDVYFTRVYNPLWTNPDGFVWLQALRDSAKIGCHVALTPTWNETAYFADYVLPMGHAGERHDLMSQETHSAKWIGFRQPVRRVALEREGRKVEHTRQTNPGEVWEEAEFWVELSGKIDPDGALGIRTHFESPDRPGELISQDEYWAWIFDNSVPGLPEAAAAEDLSPLQYMRKYGAFELPRSEGRPFERLLTIDETMEVEEGGRILDHRGRAIGVRVGETPRVGFGTPSRRLELFSSTMVEWGWPGRQYALPWSLPSHVHPSEIDEEAGEMVLLPNFRLPTLIHSRSANSKWLYEISHTNPVWIHPNDARRIGVESGDLVRVDTEIGYFVDSVWETEAIRPGIVAVSHHLGRWRLDEESGVGRGSSNLVQIIEEGEGGYRISVKHGAKAWESCDPDTSRIWWQHVGVHQNLAHAVHPDPVSGAHCWLQKALSVRKAKDGEALGDVFVDTRRSMEVYREWRSLARSATDYSPDGTRRPAWLKRPLKPKDQAYLLSQSRARQRPS